MGKCRAWLIEAVKKYLLLQKLQRKDIAALVGISERTLYSYERGERTPRVGRAKALASLLGFEWNLFYLD